MVTLTYSTTNTILYIDGALSATGAVVNVVPGPDVRTNGFWLGSDSTGLIQARGFFDDVYAFDKALDAHTVANMHTYFRGFYGVNPFNFVRKVFNAPSEPSFTAGFNAVTGS